MPSTFPFLAGYLQAVAVLVCHLWEKDAKGDVAVRISDVQSSGDGNIVERVFISIYFTHTHKIWIKLYIYILQTVSEKKHFCENNKQLKVILGLNVCHS